MLMTPEQLNDLANGTADKVTMREAAVALGSARVVARHHRADFGSHSVNAPGSLACPFCGFYDTAFVIDGDDAVSVGCDGCGAQGPLGKSEEEAVALWNVLDGLPSETLAGHDDGCALVQGDHSATCDCTYPARAAAASPPVVSRQPNSPDVCCRMIEEALHSYRLRNMVVDSGDGQRLVDALTPDGDDTIRRGMEEVSALAEHLFDELPSFDGDVPPKMGMREGWCNKWPCINSPIVNGRCHNGHDYASGVKMPARYCPACNASGDKVGEAGAACWTPGCDGVIASGTKP